jgi:hypothetical protein
MNSRQERPPRVPAGAEAGLDQEFSDTGRRYLNPEPGELSHHPPVAPARVLARQPQDERSDLRTDWRATGSPARIAPVASDHPTVLQKQGLRSDEERGPAPPGQQPAGRRQEGTIGRLESRPPNLTPQDRELVAEHDDLELLVLGGAGTQRHQFDQPAQREVQERISNRGSPRFDVGRLTLVQHEASFSPSDRVCVPHRPRRSDRQPDDLPGRQRDRDGPLPRPRGRAGRDRPQSRRSAGIDLTSWSSSSSSVPTSSTRRGSRRRT